VSFVVDASVTLAWLFEDESNDYTEKALSRLETENALVPVIWLYEVANVLVLAERRGRITEAVSRQFRELLSRLPIQVHHLGLTELWSSATHLAREHGLTAYDAAYLELAMREGLPLATQDKTLKEAARAAGVPDVG